jgi:hypothetical protein
MDVTGVVVSFEDGVQVAKNGGGSYPGARFSYRDDTGALKEKGFHANVFKFNAPLKVQLSNLKAGQPFVMNMEKEGEFWNVKSILPTSVPAASATVQEATKATPFTSPKSTYETPEERAKKQIYIVRQSCINYAILYKGAKANINEIITIAKQFEAHVFGEAFDDGTLQGMPNDTEGII